MAMGRLASFEAISAPSATGIVGRLLEKGLVERTPDPTDLRSMVVGITPEGTAALMQRRQERTAYLLKRIEVLTEQERKVLSAAVKILEVIHEDP
jgi:DNA-binding MarR family transcriptional regulator